MAGKRRDPAHRAIIYGGILGGLTHDAVNRMLRDVNERDLPEASYRSIREHYVPYFKEDLSRLGRAIQHPPTWADLRKAGATTPSGAKTNEDPSEE